MPFPPRRGIDPDAELRRRADANFCEMFGILARAAAATAAAGAGVRERADGCLIATGVPVPLFNPAFVRSAARLSDFVAEARDFFAGRRLPWALVLPEHAPAPPTRPAIRANALFVLQTMPVYTHPTLPGASWPTFPEGDLEIRDAGTDSGVVADHRALLAAAFGIPESYSRIVLPEAPAAPCLRLYVAYANGAPVGSAALCLAGGVAGLYNVAAHPEHRRRGIATALMRRALHDARARGLETCILQSSSAGLPLYARLGFRQLATYAVYGSRER